jgi:DNA-binding NtrC family response regulator
MTNKTIKSKIFTVLVVDDHPQNLDILIAQLYELGLTTSVAFNGEQAIEMAKKILPDIIILDVVMPGIDGFETCKRLKKDPTISNIPVIFMTALSDMVEKIKGFEAGGVDYITKPFQNQEVLVRLKTHMTIYKQQKKLEKQNAELIKLNEQFKQEISRREKAEDALQVVDTQLSIISEQEAKRWGLSAFIGKSPTMAAIFENIRRLQDVEKTSVLIMGESGTGKELIARAIHFGSARAKAPFISVNCSAIPTELAESAFFGHVRGAFTGAVNNRKGYFELAKGGTLFLDEIGDMPKILQVKLLRTLEDGTLMPVGSNQEKKVEFRVIAATNADLHEKIATGEFRNDLYFRLASYTVYAHPLRERKEDIPLLVEHMLSRFATEMGRPKASLTQQALEVLENYSFSGNVRELKNIIEHALINSNGALIKPQHFPFSDGTLTKLAQSTSSQTVKTVSSLSGTSPILQNRVISTPSEPFLSTQTLQVNDEENILAYVREHGGINNTQCRQLLNLDYHKVSYILKNLNRKGLLVREGERRWSYYRLSEFTP